MCVGTNGMAHVQSEQRMNSGGGGESESEKVSVRARESAGNVRGVGWRGGGVLAWGGRGPGLPWRLRRANVDGDSHRRPHTNLPDLRGRARKFSSAGNSIAAVSIVLPTTTAPDL